MGNIINFMDKLGSSADLQELTEEEALKMLQQITDEKQDFFHTSIESLLDARKNLVCGVAPAEEPQEETPDEDDTPEDEDA